MWTCEHVEKIRWQSRLNIRYITYFDNFRHQQTGEVCPAFAFDAFEPAEVVARGIGAGSTEPAKEKRIGLQ